jgi:hypothetical protein
MKFINYLNVIFILLGVWLTYYSITSLFGDLRVGIPGVVFILQSSFWLIMTRAVVDLKDRLNKIEKDLKNNNIVAESNAKTWGDILNKTDTK